MSDSVFRNSRILVVEDEFGVAADLCAELSRSGAGVIGPAGTPDEAIGMIKSRGPITAAILDINLRGRDSYQVADLLISRGIPFVFATGHDGRSIPHRYLNVVRCENPVSIAAIGSAIRRALRRET